MGVNNHHIGVIASSRQTGGSDTWTNLLAWWDLDETSGDAIDSHTSGYDLSISGATQTTSGLVCDGTDDYGHNGSLPTVGTTETFLFWVQPNSDPTCIIIGASSGGLQIRMVNSYNLDVGVAGGSSTTDTALSLTNATMNFVSVVINGSTVRFGVNASYESETYSLTPTSYTGYIGAGVDINDLNGTIKKVAWFTDAKSDAYITAFYNSGSGTEYADGDPA